MATKCENCPLRKLPYFFDLSDIELKFIDKFKVGELSIAPKTQFLSEGTQSPNLYTALEGMGLRYKLLPNGRRQVINMVFPGDFIGLQAGLLGEMQHSVEATTQMTLCVFERNELGTFFKQHPERAFDITWIAAHEEHFLGSALASLGQRDARERIAWAIVSLFQRATALELVEGDRMPFPYRQQDLADALGLSLVHTNKTLARLREQQIASWTDGVLAVHDLGALAQIAMVELEEPEPRPLM